MTASMQLWPPRPLAGGYVAVAAGVATLVRSLGRITGVVRNSAGNYTIAIGGDGVGPAPLPAVTPVNNVFAAVVCTFGSPNSMTVLAFDAAGVAADTSFSFQIFSGERNGAAT